ncbi:polysaccharide deacetylase family protein [Galbibacter sp. EGI 63066]|uniref:polysaccharide deacetylase family protein n=1 Tax=Galbibacter sp. EGI 63066 TaxID=2993559 RepID=UPI0022488CB0|nr:polysaccharide deacetylase family protein [Galbibacter sp. EGI 63066]MCX2681016.1 polysaccharide deacetylase family protein [Galbibacter sp. EGI 63066]
MESIAEELGYVASDKLLIIHADDAGLCYAENRATKKALKEGVVNSYSIMMPCPWAYEMASFAKEHPQYDGGIHLTLTSEWKHYKFEPVLSAKEVPSLVDENGRFYPKRAMVKENAIPSEIKKELKAQIERAIAWGVKPTHLDSHMFTMGLTEEIIQVYRELGEEFKLPVFLSKQLLGDFKMRTEKHIRETDFTIENVFTGEWSWFEGKGLAAYYDHALNNLQAGINILLIHTAFNDEEMQGVAIDHPNFGAEWRQADLDYFTSTHAKEMLEKQEVKLITWRDIQKIMF